MSNHFYLWAVVMVKPDGSRMLVKSGLNRFKAQETKEMLNQAAALEGLELAFVVERRAA